MRLCMIASEFPPTIGGVSHYVSNLSSQLTARGHKVCVITAGSWKGFEHEYLGEVEIYRVPYLQIYPFSVKIREFFQMKMFRLLEPNFDIIHVHHPLSPVIRTSLPSVATIHSSLGLSQNTSIEYQNFYSSVKIPGTLLGPIRRYVGTIEKGILRNADVVTVVSKALAQELARHHGVDLDSIRVLGNGVDTTVFSPMAAKENRPYVINTGRLSWNKGLIDLAQSARYVLRDHPEMSFVLTGRGPIENCLRKLVANMNIYESFKFVGFVDRKTLIEYYRRSTVYVCPSYYEGLPTSLLEAMACGIPVVATNVGGIPEVIRHGENGFLVPTRNPKAIADCVNRLLSDEGLRARMGRNARETIERYYGWDKIATSVLNCYKSAMNNC